MREPDFGRQERYLQGQLVGDRPHLVLALGSSRTLTGFRGETVSDDLSEAWSRKVLAFNFGRPAFGPVMELVYLRRLLKDGVRPDLLLVEVLPALLARRNTGVVEERLRRSEVQALVKDGYLDEGAPRRAGGARTYRLGGRTGRRSWRKSCRSGRGGRTGCSSTVGGGCR